MESPALMSKTCPIPLLLALFLLVVSPSTSAGTDGVNWLTGLPKEDKLLYTNLAIGGAIIGWGIANWDYGSRSPRASNEGWFGRNTKHGGADKLGHAYMTYVFTHSFSWLYKKWGYENDDAALYGTFSALAMQTLMEVGDSFSSHGFSWEDMVMNAVGAGAGYLTRTHPNLARKVDFRVEYNPKFDTADVFTDYENQKYLMAVKLDGFDAVPDNPLRYVELHLGYYTRGYKSGIPEARRRNVYVGVGLNVSRLLKQWRLPIASTITRYYQVPGTSLQFNKDLDR